MYDREIFFCGYSRVCWKIYRVLTFNTIITHKYAKVKKNFYRSFGISEEVENENLRLSRQEKPLRRTHTSSTEEKENDAGGFSGKVTNRRHNIRA
jgi:hypothetical protein